MTLQRRLAVFTVGTLVLLGLGVAYLVFASNRVEADLAERSVQTEADIDSFEASIEPSGPVAAEDLTELRDTTAPAPQPGEVVVVHRVPGVDYGRLAIRHVDGTRTLLDRRCMRVHIAAENGICLEQTGEIIPTFQNVFFDAGSAEFPEYRSYSSPLPSRARVSPSGLLSSSTYFAEGYTYEDITGDTVSVVALDWLSEERRSISLGGFTLDDSPSFVADSAKFWGVTFAADDNEFWVTAVVGGQPEILQGSIADRELTRTGFMGSCPSLSPDGKTLVFKQAADTGNGFVPVAVDLSSGEQWTLGETRSFDDQVEWLDNDTILYAVHPDQEIPDPSQSDPLFNIWALDVATGAEPTLFLPAADSPAVIR